MPRRYNIRWNDDDRRALSTAVRVFNTKITRLEKQLAQEGKKKSHLPERVSVEQLKSMIDTRQDFNREINSLKRFMRPDAAESVSIPIQHPDPDYTVNVTKWQKQEMSRRAAYVNQRRKRLRNEMETMEMTAGGEKTGMTLKDFGMGKQAAAFQPIDPFETASNEKDAMRMMRKLRRESALNYYDQKTADLRRNYIEKALKVNFAEEDIQEVIDAIEEMSFSEFYQKFQQEGGTMENAYPGKKPQKGEEMSERNLQYEGYVEKLKSTWLKK